MNTEDGNKIIAEFMGGKFIKSDPMFFNGNSSFYYFKTEGKSANNLQYHSSWDWLMPVVEKIEGLGFRFKQCRRKVEIEKDIAPHLDSRVLTTKEDAKIKSAWQAVIQFIEWYNKEQSVKVSDTTKTSKE